MAITSRLEPTVATLRSVAEGDPRIVGLYLFGSHAEGSATPDSDLDLGVLFDRPSSIRDRVHLEARLSNALDREVDLVDLGTCSAFLALSIIRGERLYCADPDRCDEFDLYVMRRAGDLAPFERQRRRMVLGDEAVVPAQQP